MTLLLLVHPSNSYFFGIGSSVLDSDGYEIINPLDSWFLGGGTSLVYNAITLNFFGIKELLRGWYHTIASTVIFDGGGLLISSTVNIIVAIIVAVIEIVTTIISNVIESSWRKKLAFLEFLFRVATGRSFEGVVEFARAFSETEEGDEL